MNSATDDLDLPQEWLYPVMMNVAALLCKSYGKFQEFPSIQADADKYYQVIKNASADDTTIRIRLKK